MYKTNEDELGMVEIDSSTEMTDELGIQTNEDEQTNLIYKTNEDELGMVDIDKTYRDDRRTWYTNERRRTDELDIHTKTNLVW